MRKPVTRFRRSAFTLIDVVVVAAVTAVLTGLVFPAVQQAREKSMRATCTSRMKAIGLGLHNYHDVYSRFPAAWFARSVQPDSPSWIGWQTSLLPYVENAQLFSEIFGDVWKSQAAPEWPGNRTMMQRHLPVYICPMDSSGPANPARSGYGTSNYSGNFGPEPLPRWHEAGLEEFWPGGVAPLTASAGIFCMNYCVNLREITDGTSNTVMVSERSVRSAAGLWGGVRSNRHENDVVTDMSFLSPLNKSFAGFSSPHGKTVNMLFCDGAVRAIRDDIESREDGTGILQRLSNRADGQPVTSF